MPCQPHRDRAPTFQLAHGQGAEILHYSNRKFGPRGADAGHCEKSTSAAIRSRQSPRADKFAQTPRQIKERRLNRARGVSLIRDWTGTYVAAYDRARLDEVLDADNTASDVWADAAYPSAKNNVGLHVTISLHIAYQAYQNEDISLELPMKISSRLVTARNRIGWCGSC